MRARLVPAKRILMFVVMAVCGVGVISCVRSCESSSGTQLQFVNGGEAKQSSTQTHLVIVTHGWIRKGQGGWPEDMAVEIGNRSDPNTWLCGYFDWSEGAKTLYATHAAKYARDVAGPRLANEIIKTAPNCRHIHLIGHSSGCWAVSEAAKILVKKTKADIHLTFFDAYVPFFWRESSLGNLNRADDVNCWAEHYYTRDLTLGWTQKDLSFAHNVDITNIDGLLRDHNFPWQWYYATIGAEYHRGSFEGNIKQARPGEGVEYGFARSREAACDDNWHKSLKLPVGNEAVKLKHGKSELPDG